MKILSKLDNTGMIDEVTDKRYVTDAEKSTWNGKADKTYVDNKVKTDVPAGAKFTDTVYTHPESHPASMITDLPTGKKVARFVVGTSTRGWTTADCDYLCDGTADQVEINNAIAALPTAGGEIVILDGTYNITAKIDVTKNNVSIRGNGNATILKRMFNSSVHEGVITLTNRSGCKIANLQIEGNKTNYTNNSNSGIYLDFSSNNTITGNTSNNNGVSGLYLYNSSSNVVTGNTCNNNNYDGISLRLSSSHAVTGNTCNNNNYDGIFLEYSSNNNTVTGNICIRGTGLATDYAESQNTIQLYQTGNSYNLISNNNCMGKAPFVGGGTGNSVYGNKYDSGDYKDFTQDEKTKLAGIAASANNYAHPTTAGNKHIPTGGASGQILRYSASGTAVWGADNDTITTINGKTGAISKADITALGIPAQDTVYTHPTTHSISEVSGLQTALDGKVDDSQVLTNVPLNAKFTDTMTTINGKTGTIAKADIVALGIPAQDTVYTHPTGTNPHGTTKSDVGLENVTNDKQMPISGGVLENYREKLTTVSASGGSIDLSLGNVFVHTPSGNRTYSITNAVNGQAHSFTLIVNMGSTVRTLTFPTSVRWQGGEIPDMTTANKIYILTFMTIDGGTNWLGMSGGEF